VTEARNINIQQRVSEQDQSLKLSPLEIPHARGVLLLLEACINDRTETGPPSSQREDARDVKSETVCALHRMSVSDRVKNVFMKGQR